MTERDVTKERWVFVQHEETSRYFGNIIANRGNSPEGYRSIRTISVQLNHGPEEENLAYANLMAAAPDLLNALKGIINSIGEDGYIPSCGYEKTQSARVAIAKAEGR